MFRFGHVTPARTPMECVPDWTCDVVLRLGVTPRTIAHPNAQFAELTNTVATLDGVIPSETDRRGIKATVYPNRRTSPFHLVMNPGPNHKPPRGRVN
jgi:hypothetical protein